MTDPAQPSPPATPSNRPADVVHSEHSGEFLRLARLWQHKQGHSWIFAAIESSGLRDQLIARLDTQHTDARLALEAHADPVQWVARLADACALSPRAHLVLAGAWQPDAAWWQQVNTLRERLAEAFPKPMILWLPDACITLAARHAPDLWNWREAVVSFSEPLARGPAPLPSAPVNLKGGMEKEAIELRLQDISDYLATHDRNSAAAAHLLLEAAGAYERLGRWDASMTCAQEAHSRFIALGNDRLAAIAKGQIANILQARGQLDQALAIYQNEVLPVFDQLGDIRETALTNGKIADILETRGQLDQALAIRQNEELPVYAQLGDIREAAVSKSKIADILQARGQLDEALAIRQNEELPVYAQLGAIRETAITKGKMADILQARGQLDQALAIRQNEQLPVYAQLGDIRETAVTKGKIADILEARGQLDQALAIRQNEQLPVYAQLGDIHGTAITKGKIADILQARGQLEQALAIRQNDELPVYTQLGAIRDTAITKGKIAEILQARGQLEQALLIWQEQVLPVFESVGYTREAGYARERIKRLQVALGQRAKAKKPAHRQRKR